MEFKLLPALIVKQAKTNAEVKKTNKKNKHVILFFTPFAVSLHNIYIIYTKTYCTQSFL